MNLLLLCIPLAMGLKYMGPADPALVFFAAALAIIPLAGRLCRATECLADRLGHGVGGLLNATFNNAPELIIGVMALRAGLYDVVKAAITGSIIGNVLFVLGTSAILGGTRHKVLRFNRSAASISATMLALSAVGLILPALFHAAVRDTQPVAEQSLSLAIALVLLITYLLGLFFSLKTHRHLYSGPLSTEPQAAAAKPEDVPQRAVAAAVLDMAVSAALLAWLSEIFVGALAGAARQMGLSEIFLGIIFVAMVGNIGEYYTTIMMALRNKMDIAIQTTIGSSIQVALLVAPALLVLSYFVGPTPMDLRFTTLEVAAVIISVGAVAMTSHDGDLNWIEGVQLVAVYLMLAFVFYWLPA